MTLRPDPRAADWVPLGAESREHVTPRRREPLVPSSQPWFPASNRCDLSKDDRDALRAGLVESGSYVDAMVRLALTKEAVPRQDTEARRYAQAVGRAASDIANGRARLDVVRRLIGGHPWRVIDLGRGRDHSSRSSTCACANEAQGQPGCGRGWIRGAGVAATLDGPSYYPLARLTG